MIRLVERSQLNVEKYNTCITISKQSRIYAYSWYLDIVADNWSVLVLDDYNAVMPLPWKSKFMIHYISQPFFSQQLGVFSKEELTTIESESFIDNIPKHFLKIALQFNSGNHILNDKTEMKNNFILDLNSSYEELYKSFSKGRKHAIQKGLRNEFIVEEVQFNEVLKLSKENYSFKELSENDYLKLSTLIRVAKDKKQAKIIGIIVNDELIGGSVFLLDSKRIVYLFSAVSSKGKEMQVGSLLLNSIIKEFSNSKLILDFEGSMNPSIASFFKSFGSKIETYLLFKKRLL